MKEINDGINFNHHIELKMPETESHSHYLKRIRVLIKQENNKRFYKVFCPRSVKGLKKKLLWLVKETDYRFEYLIFSNSKDIETHNLKQKFPLPLIYLVVLYNAEIINSDHCINALYKRLRCISNGVGIYSAVVK